MNRLEFKWMGRYFDVIDNKKVMGEVYYSVGNRCWQLHMGDDTHWNCSELKQVLEFMKRENESNNSYA